MEPGIYQRIYTADQISASGLQPLLSTETPDPSRGYVIVNESFDSTRPIQLLQNVVIPPEKQLSYDLAEALFDNYDLAANLPDEITPQESEEVDILLEYVIDTAPMRVAREYIEQRTARTFSDTAWYASVKETWFQPFQIGSSPTRSGFEHVFLGEDKDGKVGGLHWWYFYYKKMGNMKYRGAVYTNMNRKSGISTPEVATLGFSWKVGGKEIVKPIGGFFVGPSVEGLMAIGMVRANADAGASNLAVIEGVEVELKVFTSPSGRSINTLYPIFRRLITGVGKLEGEEETEVKPTPISGTGQGSTGAVLNGGTNTVRIISAVVNPEGHDASREKITLMNMSSTEAVKLEGWRVTGPNKSYLVFGEVEVDAGSATTFTIPERSGLQLSNKGGELSIVDATGNVVHVVKYSREAGRVQGGVLMWSASADGDALV